MTSLVVTDNFQNYIQTNFPSIKDYPFVVDILLFCLIAYTYYFGNPELYTKLIKYTIIILIVRYLFNYITNYTLPTNVGDGKGTLPTNVKSRNHFQINAHIALFALLILTNTLLDLNTYTIYGLLIGYTLFASAVNYGYTVDNLITLVLVYNLISLRI